MRFYELAERKPKVIGQDLKSFGDDRFVRQLEAKGLSKRYNVE